MERRDDSTQGDAAIRFKLFGVARFESDRWELTAGPKPNAVNSFGIQCEVRLITNMNLLNFTYRPLLDIVTF